MMSFSGRACDKGPASAGQARAASFAAGRAGGAAARRGASSQHHPQRYHQCRQQGGHLRRQDAGAHCKTLQNHLDPGKVRKEEKAKVVYEAGNTLETVARDWLEHQAARWEPVTMGCIDPVISCSGVIVERQHR
ncbi:hypothetical protein [Curvibacter lanceolatus]|uniref:hypothetical protein n=1 Tax=Curvibacter lanceolatus TaxID=86182 RepID=UPI0012F805AA|nr:hypothetical protein [Curvibacter lanceolatus]